MYLCGSLSKAFCCFDFSWTWEKNQVEMLISNKSFLGLVNCLCDDCGAAVAIDEVAANPLRALSY